ncbi:phosphopantetheine-binding protein [Streptomyces syringium]|uniref:phosphopantetheine-binding protein n=1 Tax=Streptomyces syringium TaxID=76729 RepID=UPI003D8A198D
MPAPTYPFARESYWLTPGARFDTVQAAESGLIADADADAGAGTRTDAEGEPAAAAPAPAPVASVPAAPVPVASVPAAPAPADGDPESAVREHVRGLLAAHLGMRTDRLPVDRVLSDAGVDSLGLRRLSRRLGADYGVDIPARMFGVAQTVRAVARAVFEAYGPLPGHEEDGPDPAPAAARPSEPEPEPEPAKDGVAALLAGLRNGTVGVDDALAALKGGTGR